MLPFDFASMLNNGLMAGLMTGRKTIQPASRYAADDGGAGVYVPPNPGTGPGVTPQQGAPVITPGVVPRETPAAVMPGSGLMASHGLPNGLGNTSAGIFDQYMREQQTKTGPTFMPPEFKKLGVSPGTSPDSGTTGGPGNTGGDGGPDTGGPGGTGVTDANGKSPGDPGYVGTGTGTHLDGVNVSPAVTAALSALGWPGFLAAGLLNDYAKTNPARAQFDESSISTPSAPLGMLDTNAELGLTTAPTDIASMNDVAGLVGLGPNNDAASQGDAGYDGGGNTDSGGGEGGGDYAKGGFVRAGLLGPNPPGPDDGYASLDVGELVVPKRIAKKLNKQQVAGLLGR
jgi:hypothetical protein